MARESRRARAAELYERYRHLKNTHQEYHRQMEKMTNLYFMRHWREEGAAKEGEERVTLPTYTNTVDMALAVLLAQKRTIHAVPVNQTPEAQKTSSELEKFLNGVLYVNEVRAGEDRLALALWNALVKKLGWIRYRWVPELGEETEAPLPHLPQEVDMGPPMKPPATMMRCKELPIVIDNIPPENVFVKWGGHKGILYLFYAAKRTVEDIEAEVGRLRIEPYRSMDWQQKAEAEVTFLEYWGWQDGKLKMATLVDERFVPKRELREVEGYTDIPYIPMFCFRTPEDAPHERVRGILENMQDLVHLQEKSLTKLQRILKMFAIMPLIAEEGSGPPIEVDTSLGAVVHLKRDQALRFPVWPGTPPDFKWLLGVLEEKVQEAGFPAVSYGRGSGSLSGYAITQYNEGARARLSIPRTNYALAMTELCQGIVSLCVNFAPDLAIPVFGEYKNAQFYTSLTGNQMKGHIILVNVSSDLPGDETRKAVIGGQLKATGALSERTIMERYFGIEAPEDELQQILVERAAKHPTAMLIAMAYALAQSKDPFSQMVLQQVVQALQQVKAVQTPGGPPQPTTPGAAGPPEPRPGAVPTEVIPPIAQGQVLRQEQGLPPTQTEIMEG